MAVLIPDIGIPKTCSNCPCYDAEYEMCNLTKNEIVWSRPALTSRAEDCPLIEIVRCRECKHWERYVHDRGDDSRCDFHNRQIGRDGYCAWGHRREEDA